MADTTAPATPETPEIKTPEIPAGKTFTQDDINHLIAQQKKEAQASILKQLGVTDIDSVKDALAKFKEMQDSQKTEMQKTLEQLEAEKNQTLSAKKETEKYQGVLEAIKLGVDPNKAEKVFALSLTYEGETTADRVKAVLTEFPELIKSATVPEFGGQSRNGEVDTKATDEQILRKAMGLE